MHRLLFLRDFFWKKEYEVALLLLSARLVYAKTEGRGRTHGEDEAFKGHEL